MTMGIGETARATAHAKVSEAQAKVTQLQSQLKQAKLDLEGSSAAGDLLDSVKDTAVVGTLTSGMRDQSGVDQATAQAEVDRLTAELSSAETKLDLRRKAEAAVSAVTGGSDDDETPPATPAG